MIKDKGITLIALVITIIVMLILVAVTVSVAINGGLFSKADDAARKTQIEIDREELQAAVLDTIDNNGDLHLANVAANLDTNDTDGEYWRQDEQDNTIFTKHHKNGDTNEFTVTINANGGFTVTYVENTSSGDDSIPDEEITGSEIPEDLEKYIFGEEGTGRLMTEIAIYNEDDDIYTFLDDETLTPDIDESAAVIFIDYGSYGNDEDMLFIWIKYTVDGNLYMFKLLENENWDLDAEMTAPVSTDEKMEIYKIGKNVGKTATIDGEKYIVLYGAGEKGENVQLISANTYEANNVYIGWTDEWIDWTDDAVISAADVFSEGEPYDFFSDEEKSIYSYNHAIEKLNAKCRSVVGSTNSDIIDVRCVGSNPTNKNSENSTLYTSEFLQNNPKGGMYSSIGLFNGIGKGKDDNCEEDYMRLDLIGARASQNSKSYWLASRDIYEISDAVVFRGEVCFLKWLS